MSACSLMPTASNWPADIPAITYFESYYDKNENFKEVGSKSEYLLWVKRFYFGSFLYSRGWKQATAEVLASISDLQKREEAEIKMREIGDLVAPEWAMNREGRIINTRHIVLWGNALSGSFDKGSQIDVIDAVLLDIKSLLARQLSPKDIQAERYGESQVALDEELFAETDDKSL